MLYRVEWARSSGHGKSLEEQGKGHNTYSVVG